MPELPEVESVRQDSEKHLLGLTIRSVDASDSRSVLSGCSPSAFCNKLVGKRITAVGRRGKYFWFEFHDATSLLLHLGMTGWMAFPASGEPVPRFTRILFELDGGRRAAFTDPRRFGKVRLLSGLPEKGPPVSRLGVDPLEALPSPARLRELFQKRRIPIKGLLLDQTVFAGVGNWIADEVLYQAAIRPDRPCATLTLEETRSLRTKLLSILRTAVRLRANADEFPRQWLFHHRWGKKKDARTAKGEVIRHDTIAGRTTAWVPSRQK